MISISFPESYGSYSNHSGPRPLWTRVPLRWIADAGKIRNERKDVRESAQAFSPNTQIQDRFYMRLIKRLGHVFDIALNAMAVLSGVLLLAIMILITLAVIARYFFHSPLGWTVETSQYMLIIITYLIIAWTLRKEGHVKMDLILVGFGQTGQALINTITSTICTVACFVVTIFAVKVTWELYETDYFTPTIMMIPKFIFIAVIAFGFFMLTIQFIRRTYGFWQLWRSQPKNKD